MELSSITFEKYNLNIPVNALQTPMKLPKLELFERSEKGLFGKG